MGGREDDRKKRQRTAPSSSSKTSTHHLSNPPTNSNLKVRRGLEDLMNEVFSVDWIRVTIVGHVLRDKIQSGTSTDDLQAMRLVSKSWWGSVNKCLSKWGLSQYEIELTEENSLSDCEEVQECGEKRLDWFVSDTISLLQIHPQIPPFSLEIWPEFFRLENHQSFTNFFSTCLSGQVELYLNIPKNGGSLTFLFPETDLTFPNLQKLTLAFSGQPIKLKKEEKQFCSGSNWVALPFIQSILNGSENLKTLYFNDPFDKISHVPQGIRYLNIPPTITSLDVGGISFQLEFLLNCDLPHLSTLYFRIFGRPNENEQVFQIQMLQKFSSSLRILRIDDFKKNSSAKKPPTFLRFPQMQKLYMQC